MRNLGIELTQTELFLARLVKITRPDGFVLRVADSETALSVTEADASPTTQSYAPLPGSEISAIRHSLGGEQPSMEIAFVHSDGGTIDTNDLGMGVWDGAEVIVYAIDRNNISTLGDPLFVGSIQPVTFDIKGRGSFDCRGLAAKAEGVIQTYQAMCRTDVFSSLCQLVAADFDHAGTVGAIIDRFNFTVAGLVSPPADNWFNQGVAVANSGFKFEIGRWVQSTLRITSYLPITGRLVAGEAITLYPGCDKTIATCQTKFSNTVNFQGEPHFLGAAAALGA